MSDFFRSVYENLPTGLFVFDPEDGSIVEWSDHCGQIFQADREDVIGLNISRFFEDDEYLEQHGANAVNGNPGHELTLTGKRADGQELTITLRVFKLTTMGDDYAAAMITSTHIGGRSRSRTNRVDVQAAIAQALKEAGHRPDPEEETMRANLDLQMRELVSRERIILVLLFIIFFTMAVIPLLSTFTFISSEIIQNSFQTITYIVGLVSGMVGVGAGAVNIGRAIQSRNEKEEPSAPVYRGEDRRGRVKPTDQGQYQTIRDINEEPSDYR